MRKRLIDKLKKITVLAMDVDGVLTNGRIMLDEKGREIKIFDVHDGLGLVIFRKAGHKTAIISARSSPAVTARAEDLKIDQVFQDAYPKQLAYDQLKKKLNVTDDQICFVGDDLPDLSIFRRAGCAIAVADAAAELRSAADYVTQQKGGDGAAREVVELILKTQGKWDGLLDHFLI